MKRLICSKASPFFSLQILKYAYLHFLLPLSLIVSHFGLLPAVKASELFETSQPIQYLIRAEKASATIKTPFCPSGLQPLEESLERVIVSIIIDDLGYNRELGLKTLNLPGAVTVGIIPFSPHALHISEQAKKRGTEIILHTPMSNLEGFPLGELGLTEKMHKHDFLEALDKAIHSIPNIRGLNNHTGSLLTQMTEPMEWLMSALSKYGLYFIDSWTTPNSVALRSAMENNIPSMRRDIFLDHNPDDIAKQFQELIRVAKARGHAIAIGHPYPSTLEFLTESLPCLEAHGVDLVSVSALLEKQASNLGQIQAIR